MHTNKIYVSDCCSALHANGNDAVWATFFVHSNCQKSTEPRCRATGKSYIVGNWESGATLQWQGCFGCTVFLFHDVIGNDNGPLNANKTMNKLLLIHTRRYVKGEQNIAVLAVYSNMFCRVFRLIEFRWLYTIHYWGAFTQTERKHIHIQHTSPANPECHSFSDSAPDVVTCLWMLGMGNWAVYTLYIYVRLAFSQFCHFHRPRFIGAILSPPTSSLICVFVAHEWYSLADITFVVVRSLCLLWPFLRLSPRL